MNALVIGLSMGKQYAGWLRELGYQVTTVDVDISKQPDYTNYNVALENKSYDIIYIGTPNFTHESIARKSADHTKCLLIEKPGVATSDSWWKLLSDFPSTRIAMVKNNQYRSEISGYKNLLQLATNVNIVWSRKDGVPRSGWFTDKEKSFGGVSRDLMTHLLSYYTDLTDFHAGSKRYSLVDDKNNVGTDDYCEIQFVNNNVNWQLIACWQNNIQDQHYIEFIIKGKSIKFELGDYMTAFGGCPAGPYMSMIKTSMDNLSNQRFWDNQSAQDIWIHQQVEVL
jgi:predicted dehydrogenase